MRKFLAVPILLALSVSPFGQAASDGSNAQTSARLDQIVRSYVDDKNFTGSVLVARGDQTLLNKGYGEANREWGVPNGPDTRFRIASITK
ncbi:Beta-lactamase-like protein [Massilia sp. LC238]|nr:Beta-lactamase-like protein [Massilia sp. LC238]